MKKSLLILICALAPLFSAHAQYVGPGAQEPLTTVKQLQERGVDDQHVVLRGRLLSAQGKKRYLFADDTGQLVVKIEHKLFPQGVKVDEKTVVELRGEYDKEKRRSEVDVDMLKVVP